MHKYVRKMSKKALKYKLFKLLCCLHLQNYIAIIIILIKLNYIKYPKIANE